ncbi:MAG: cyclic-di-AMP phosphodiesterase [Clostridiales bacterium]|nr:putative signaling protein consisting of a modified domain and a domain [Oscillospiraceae bacterium]MDN5378412.1 cyclic-di-AMP phosphodiesterase [Clostridiales bacterium]
MKGTKWLLFKVTALILVLVAFASAFVIYGYNEYAFWIMLLISSAAGLAFMMQMISAQKNIHRFVTKIDSELNLTERDSLYNFPAPCIIIDSDAKILWYNRDFEEKIYPDDDPFGISLSKILNVDIEKIYCRKGCVVEYGGRTYRIFSNLTQKDGTSLSILYFDDITDFATLQKEHSLSKPTVVLIMVDNYEDLLQNVKESEKAHVLVQIEKLLEAFMEKCTGVIRRISNDRFIAVIEERHIAEMIAERFKILDKAREITVNERLCVTLSIGVGRGGKDLSESEIFAKQALDMALGRGGDQAAVKTEGGFEFFGGASKGIEKRAKVKTRIIATALIELIENSEKVYIMGHRFGDLDSVGSAVGLGGAIHNMGKPVKVVLDGVKNLAGNLIARINENEDFELFMSPEEALASINDQTLLVVVDTHNKDFVESTELYQKAKHVVVIDHHRKTVNYIDNAVIFHHEPYASSASEMVAELIQYFGDAGRLSSYYAEALLAGIMLDTKNFVMRTGVRTFEAAAFLKKLGADTVAVRSLFSNTIDSYQKKTKLVASAEVYKKCAIAISDVESEDIRVVAPQAADELLGISGVDASFVIYESNGTVYFSARSLGAMNVQVIMEKLGGGGHQTMAGAQLEGVSLESARQSLLEAIDQHIKEIS